MSKTVSPALLAHLRSRSTSICFNWKLSRLDGRIYGFTTASRDIDYVGITYAARTGFTRSAMVSGSDLAVANQEAAGVLDGAVLTEEDLLTGLWDGAAVEIFILNWADTSMGHMTLAGGRIGEVRQDRSRFAAEIRGFAQQLQQTIGTLYQPGCRHDLGNALCAVDLALLTTDALVTSATDRRTFVASSLAAAATYYDYGLVTWQSGCENTGRSMEVKEHTAGGAIVLVEPMPFTIAIGDSLAIHPGCGKRFLLDCVGKFANGPKFGGFPYTPGMDRLTRGVQ